MSGLNLNIRLIGGFLIMGLAVITGDLSGLSGISRLGADLKDVSECRLPAASSLGRLIASQKRIYRFEQSLLIPEIFADESEKARMIRQLDHSWKEAEKERQRLESLPRTEEGEALWKSLNPIWESWRKNHDRMIQFAKAGKRDGVLGAGKADDAYDQTGNVLRALSRLNLEFNEKLKSREEVIASRYKSIIVIGAIGGFVLTLVFGFFFSRTITRPIRRIIENLSESCFQFAAAADQIASVSDQLAAGTSTQAGAVKEASSVTSELASSIQENTLDVERLNTLSGESQQVGLETFELFRQAKKATKEIKLSNEQASKIVDAISEIAFKTNLLAVSAAIEAVQYNTTGVGFSVVAKEVRNLAVRSTEAANSTTTCIEENIALIDRGDDLVRASLGSFITYGEASNPIATFTGTAAEVAYKQAQGIEQINGTLSEISQMAQSNAAGAQASASVAKAINVQANSMMGIVKELKVILGESF